MTPAADWTLSGDLFVGPGSSFNCGSGLAHTISGDLSDDGLFNGGTSGVVMTGAADPVNGASIAGIGSTTFDHLTVAGVVTADSDFGVAGNFINDGTFDGSGSTVTFIGSGPSILGGATTPTPFDFLIIAKNSAVATLAVDLTGLTALTVSSGTLDISTFVITQNALGGALNVAAGALVRIGGAATLPVFDAYSLDPASTVEYYGTASQSIAPVNYGNLLSSSTGARLLPSGTTVGIAGTFVPGANAYTIANSTINYNGGAIQTITAFNYFNLVSSSSGARILGTNGIIGVAGSFTPGASAYTIADSTVNFNGGTQTVPVFTYNNLGIGGSGTKTLAGNITINGSLSLASATLNDAGFTATVKGDADNEATHTGTGKILLASGAVEHALSGGGVYGRLELDDPQGALLDATNLTVNGMLIFTHGNITTTTNKVIIGQAGSVARASGHVVGYLQKFVPTGSAVTNMFEIGGTNNYAPVTVIFTNVTTLGRLVASTTDGDHPDIANSGVSNTRGVNRYWIMTNSATVFGNYSALFNFDAGDVDGAANPANFIVAKKDAGGWTQPAITSRTATNIVARGMTNFSDFVVGESSVPPPTITTQPQSQTVNLGAAAQFNVAATGVGTLTYQWLFNGNPVAGATATNLVIANAQTNDAGTYSVVVDNGSQTTSSGALLTVNQPPTLANISDQSLNELETLTVATSATDPEAGSLTYQLTQFPAGASIDSSGVVSWTPTEAQGPSTNAFTVQVADNGTPPLTDSKSFTVVVNEVNTRPVLTVPATQTIAELTTLSVNATATDSDVPANTLSFALVSGPPGLTVSSGGGITWTPGEAQGPSTNPVTVRVFDNGSPSLGATNTFQVIVTEVNSAPVLTLPADQTIAAQTTLSVNATAVDSDVPANTLTFALVSGPAGLTVSSGGAITWTPTATQGPSTNVVTVRVSDDGSPSLSATNSFRVIVTAANTAPVLTVPSNKTIREILDTLVVTNTATDADVPANTLTFALVSAPVGVNLNPNTGVLSWTPTEAQGPSTNVITVKVSDNGSPSLSATNSFQVIVTEVNSVPALVVPANQTIDELSTLVVTNRAGDPDVPANTFTFSLVSAPTGVSLDANTGVLTWTPTEAQGPSTNPITVRVTDNGTPALSSSRSFTVVVKEVNAAPVLAAIPDRTNYLGTTVTFSATATDPDIPANTLTFTLGTNSPAGAVINPNTGAFQWTIPGPNSSTNSITVVVTDNGSPTLSSSQTFTVVGRIATVPLVLDSQMTNGNFVINFAGIPGEAYRVQATPSLSPPIQWSTLSTNVASTNGLFQFVDTQAKNFPMRFYRAINP